jgi:hypothetical protein
LDDQKLEKKSTAEKIDTYLFKNCNLLISIKDVPAGSGNCNLLIPIKDIQARGELPALQNMKFFNFFSIFAVLDPDLLTLLKSDPSRIWIRNTVCPDLFLDQNDTKGWVWIQSKAFRIRNKDEFSIFFLPGLASINVMKTHTRAGMHKQKNYIKNNGFVRLNRIFLQKRGILYSMARERENYSLFKIYMK